jgi:Tol biopolymer transport system component
MNPSQIDRLNTALAGRYRIERELGEGGMATVYLCEDVKHDRKVALKLLKPELAAVLGAERFLQEIKTTAALQHPHILPLFDSGAADGFLFYVMPYIKGETLRDKLNRETQLGVEEAVRITREVADALDYAHRNGVVHRDIKPENILMNDGRPMVADFGIALAVSAAAGGRMTETGLSLGTPHYMSPEQATAEKEITARSDVYSVGSVLYEMLTGNPPFTGAVAQQIIMKIITEPAESVTKHRKSVPLHVADALAKSLEKLPADRFESAKAFAEALGNPLYRSGAVQASGMHIGGGAASSGRFKSVALIASALAAVLLGTTLWGWLKPAAAPVVSRNSIILWENPQIPSMRVGRGLAISPDGGTVVFMDGDANSTQLYVKERDRLEVTALAGTAGVAGAPTFSPDGAWIAFVTRGGTVQKVPRLGGSAIAIADSAEKVSPALAWLEDGTILFVDGHIDIKAVGQDGGIARHVLTNTPGDSANRNMRYLASVPGVKAALVVACAPGCDTPELRVLDLRSDQPKVTMLATQVLNAWSLPGGIVAFVRRDGGVFAAPFDNSTLTFTQPPTPMMSGVRTSVTSADMVVSANGTAIYVAGTSSSGSTLVEPVWVTRAGTVTPMESAWTMNIAQALYGNPVALSPDGQRLALTVARTNSNENDIWIKQLDRTSGTLTKLTFEGNNLNPVWTPNGQRVLYAGVSSALRSRRADGTGAVDTLLRSRRDFWTVVLTPDSNTFLLRLSTTPTADIVLAHRGDTATVPLVASPAFNETSPALSPDGRWLAYTSDESGRNEVYVRPYPNVDAGRWQVSQAGGSSPHWSHTGRELFYENGAKALVATAVVPGVTFTVGAQVTLFNTSGFAGTGGAVNYLHYDVAPDDQRFVFFRKPTENGEATVDPLVQMVNWNVEVRAKLKGKTPQ